MLSPTHCLGCLALLPSPTVFTQKVLNEMEDDRFDVSQSGGVIPTPERDLLQVYNYSKLHFVRC